MTAHILTCSEAEYHADPVPVSLSQSTAKVLIKDSPLHAWWTHPRLGGRSRAPTKAMAAGSSLDRLLFGGLERLAVLDYPDYRTKTAQSERDAAIAAGLTPVLAHVHRGHEALATLVRDAVMATLGYDLASCDHQLAIAWKDASGCGCRTKLDVLTPDREWILDLKTGSRAEPEWLHRHCVDQGWDIQAAAELEAVGSLYPATVGRCRFADVVVEDGSGHERPSCVTVYEITDSMLALGQRRWARAKELWSQCLRANDWPPYSTTVVQAVAPAWMLATATEPGDGLDWS